MSKVKEIFSTEERGTIERWCRDRARAVPMPDGRTLCRVLGEHPMVVSLKDLSIAPHLALDGFWEVWLSMRLARGLRPGWRCIDVGANVGYFTLLMALVTGAEVEAWEPTIDCAAALQATVRMNGLKRSVSIVPFAAGAEDGVADIYRNLSNYGSVTMLEAFAEQGAEAQQIEVRRLDNQASRFDFIKIDAEGYEPQVWRGMRGMRARHEPKAMLMEWTPKRYENARAFLDEIVREGFSVQIVDASGGLQKPVGDITAIEGHMDLWLER